MIKFNHALAAACGVALTLAFAGPAMAGKCPEGKKGVDVREMSKEPAAGVKDEVKAHIDLSKEPAKIEGLMLRMRRLVVQPGGVVPWHSHENRPALILIDRGEITEFASTCSVGIVHHAGDIATETHPTSHWWKNEGKVPAVLYSADLFPTEMMGKPEEQHM